LGPAFRSDLRGDRYDRHNASHGWSKSTKLFQQGVTIEGYRSEAAKPPRDQTVGSLIRKQWAAAAIFLTSTIGMPGTFKPGHGRRRMERRPRRNHQYAVQDSGTIPGQMDRDLRIVPVLQDDLGLRHRIRLRVAIPKPN